MLLLLELLDYVEKHISYVILETTNKVNIVTQAFTVYRDLDTPTGIPPASMGTYVAIWYIYDEACQDVRLFCSPRQPTGNEFTKSYYYSYSTNINYTL